MKIKKVMVFSESVSAARSLCSGGNALADETLAVVLGNKEEAEGLLGYATEVLWLGEKAEGYMVEDYVPAIARFIKERGPELVLIAGTIRGRCVAARLAVLTEAGVVSDAGAVSVSDDGMLLLKRKVYGGAAAATVKALSAVTIATVSGGVFEACAPETPGKLTVVEVEPERRGVECISISKKQEENVDITVAKRVVGVGRGVGTQENLVPIRELAVKLGAEMACTRPIAEEEHWMSRGRYVGVSGATIKPCFYLACGISGQVQHMAGVNGAKVIIAINKDGKAPIFRNCDYGIVGDLNKIVPELMKQL